MPERDAAKGVHRHNHPSSNYPALYRSVITAPRAQRKAAQMLAMVGEKTLEEDLQLLHILTAVKPVDYADETFHKDFFDHVDKKIVPRVPAEQHPPASVLVYAARNIMKPQFVITQIPDLLTLLGHLNVLRKFAVTKVSYALAWHKRFRDNPAENVSLLSPDIQARLERARDRAQSYQQLYRHVVNTCYEVDIHHTFLHGSPKMFWSKMQTYFPGQFTDEYDDETSKAAAQARTTRLYHHDLTEEELRDSRNTGVRCAKFSHDAARYMEDPATFCAEVGTPGDTPMEDLFPCPDTAALVCSTDKYLDHVLKLVTVIERLFPVKNK